MMGSPEFFTGCPRRRPSLPAAQAVGGVHRDGADRVLTEVERNLEGEVVVAVVDRGVRCRQRGEDLGDLTGRELDVHHGAHHLRDLSVFCHRLLPSVCFRSLGLSL